MITILDNPVYYDERGYLASLFNWEIQEQIEKTLISSYKNSHALKLPRYANYSKYGDFLNFAFPDDRISHSTKGVIRGFHGDANTWKVVSVIDGNLTLHVYDLINDKLETVKFTGPEKIVLIPPWHLNAHEVHSKSATLWYKWSEPYRLDKQWSVCYNDPAIGAEWTTNNPVLSERDRTSGTLKELREKI